MSRESCCEGRDGNLLSLDAEFMGDKYCDDEDSIDVVVDAVVKEIVVVVLDVDAAVEDMDNNDDAEC